MTRIFQKAFLISFLIITAPQPAQHMRVRIFFSVAYLRFAVFLGMYSLTNDLCKNER